MQLIGENLFSLTLFQSNPSSKLYLLKKWIVGSLNVALCVVGALSGCGCRTREDDRGWACVQHPPGCQLPGFPAEEELAERACPLHQEHHGQTPTPLLNYIFSVNKRSGDDPKLTVFGSFFICQLYVQC